MMKIVPLFLFSLLSFGQTIHIAPGDKCYTGGQVWPGPIVEWGTYFVCSIPIKAGTYNVTFATQEIPVSGINAAGQRVFTISMLGQTTMPIDLFKSVGIGPWTLTTTFTVLFDQTMPIYFRAQVRNALMTTIDISPNIPAPTPININNDQQVTGAPCPAGWAGKRLPDGNCLIINP